MCVCVCMETRAAGELHGIKLHVQRCHCRGFPAVSGCSSAVEMINESHVGSIRTYLICFNLFSLFYFIYVFIAVW